MSSSRRGLRIGIVNPTTFVGRELKSILHERGVPYIHIELIDTTGQSAGTLTEVDEEAAVVTAATESAFIHLDVVFFCGPAETTAPWIAKHKDLGFLAVDLSQPSSMVKDGIPVIAGLNTDLVTNKSKVIISPHPIAIPIALILESILKLSPVSLAAVSAIQPASEYDKAGVDELLEQIVRVLNVEEYPQAVFDRQLAFNLFPAARGFEIEQYAVSQLHRIFRRQLQISIALTQGSAFHGHSFSIFVQTELEVTQQDLLVELRKSDVLLVADTEDTFGTLDAGGKDQVLIGRVARDPNLRSAYWIWAVVDNLRRSSALNAVLAAEAVMARLLADA
jgi:aspartate-semialdehyde dehydrogenase